MQSTIKQHRKTRKTSCFSIFVKYYSIRMQVYCLNCWHWFCRVIKFSGTKANSDMAELQKVCKVHAMSLYSCFFEALGSKWDFFACRCQTMKSTSSHSSGLWDYVTGFYGNCPNCPNQLQDKNILLLYEYKIPFWQQQPILFQLSSECHGSLFGSDCMSGTQWRFGRNSAYAAVSGDQLVMNRHGGNMSHNGSTSGQWRWTGGVDHEETGRTVTVWESYEPIKADSGWWCVLFWFFLFFIQTLYWLG